MGSPFDPRVKSMPSVPRVLIVDHPQRQDDLRQESSAQWQIETASTAADALRKLMIQPFDLILADIRLLEIDGNPFGLLQHIRGDAALRHLGVILITDQAHEITMLDALMAGADDYISTPFSSGDLVMRLRAQLTLRQRQETAQELVTQEQRTEDILESIGDLFYAIDENFCFIYVNQKAEEAWGRQRKDLLGKHYWTEFPAVVGSESYLMHLKVMAERQPLHYETIPPLLHRWIEVRIYPNSRGGLVVYFHNIEDRKQRELNRSFLAEIDANLVSLSDAAKALDTISEKIVGHFGLTQLTYSRIDLSVDQVVDFYERHEADGISRLQDLRLSEVISQDDIHTLSAGQLIVRDDATAELHLAPVTALYPDLAYSQVFVPHLIEGQWRFMLSAQRPEPSVWRADELDLLRELTARIALWLERTRAEQRLRVALNGARLGAWEWDIVHDTSVSDLRTQELLAVPFGESLSMASLMQRIPLEDRASVQTAIKKAFDPEGTGWYDVTYRVTPPGPNECWVHLNGQTIFEGEGTTRHAVRMFGIVRDVTDMKRSQFAQQQLTDELAWQGRRFEAIASTAEDAIYTFDPSGHITYANRMLLKLWQKTSGQALGKTLMELNYPPDEAARITHQVEQVVATQQPLRDESIPLDFGDRSAAYEYILTPVINANGVVEAVAGISRDTTERTQAERRMRMLQQLAADLSSRLTAHDMGKSILQACRQAVDTTMLSLFLLIPEEQVLERIFTESFSQEIKTRYHRIPLDMHAPLAEAGRTKQIVWGSTQADYIQRYPHLREDIVQNNVHAYIALPLVIAQHVLGVISISFSQPKLLSPQEHELLIAVAHLCAQALERARLYEAEKEAREVAEKANQVKLQFLAMISHELRTPLASIKGFTSTLLATDVTFSPEEYQDFLSVVDQETDKLTDLVVQLLDLTRLQAGTMHIEMRPHTLHDVLMVAQAQLSTLARYHQLVIQIPDDLSAVLGDPQRLSQVLINLVGNATKFSPEGTSITLRAFQNHDSIQIDVSDEGMGIPPENRMEVFEVFQQVEKTAQHDPGAGLGLAICKGIIEAHGGRIWVQDREPGTTISFILRVVTKEEDV